MAAYEERFAAVTSFDELIALARSMHGEERSAGNLAFLSQMLAGSQAEPKLAPATAEGLGLWIAQVEAVLERLFARSPFAQFVDMAGLSRAVAAGFVGLELYEGVDEEGAASALNSLNQLANVLTMVDKAFGGVSVPPGGEAGGA